MRQLKRHSVLPRTIYVNRVLARFFSARSISVDMTKEKEVTVQSQKKTRDILGNCYSQECA